MSSENLILKYLADTFSIREVKETLEPLNPEEMGVKRCIFAPWSLVAVSSNTGVPVEEVEKIVGSFDSFTIVELQEDGKSTKVIVTDVELENPASVYGHSSLKQLSVSSLMTLHVLQFIQVRVAETKSPVKIEDAIFDLKNSLLIPDDFMPSHLMGMVEGISEFSVKELRDLYSIIEGVTSIYFYQECKEGDNGRIRYLYPSSSGSIEGSLENEKIREVLAESFKSIQNEKSYVDFINSRLIKTLLYNMQKKNSRELKRPIFNPVNIKVLEGYGIVEHKDGSSFVKETVTVDQLNDLYNVSKSEGEKLAKSWLSGIVEVS